MNANSQNPMKNKILIILVAGVFACLSSCKKEGPEAEYAGKIEVIINDIPFKTDQFLRIPYTLKMWEFDKVGLRFVSLTAVNKATGEELMTITEATLPIVYTAPLDANPYYVLDPISDYYLSLQLPIPLTKAAPAEIIHRFEFRDTLQNKTLEFEAGAFKPRLSESPLVISSPVKGADWLFINQSTNAYHFYTLFFMDGEIYTPERFAFDNLRMNPDLTDIHDGDPLDNHSYYNYRDTLYAVANGTVVYLKDGQPENHGDAQDVTFSTALDLAGNYLIVDIGAGRYAYYCHCVPNSFLVRANEAVKEGDPIALLGNSGNSTAPHLHFQITDGTDLFHSHGIPFVLKSFAKTGDLSGTPTRQGPQEYKSSMMEQWTLMKF